MPGHAAPLAEASFNVTLDIDNDGKTDRAATVENADNGQTDLYIYLGSGDTKLDLSDKPTFLRKALTDNRITGVESKSKGSLAITSCFGCGASKSWEETLTIVYRHGNFIVAGYSRDWDWNVQTSDGDVKTKVGSCDINYLTGKGVASRDLSDGKPVHGKFVPVDLAHWSYDKRPKPCTF